MFPGGGLGSAVSFKLVSFFVGTMTISPAAAGERVSLEEKL